MPRLHATELDAPPGRPTPDLCDRLEAAGFDLTRETHWIRHPKRGVVFYQGDDVPALDKSRPLSGDEG